MLRHEGKIKVELIKKIKTENKTTLQIFQELKLEKVIETENVNKLYPNKENHWTKRVNLCGSETSLW